MATSNMKLIGEFWIEIIMRWNVSMFSEHGPVLSYLEYLPIGLVLFDVVPALVTSSGLVVPVTENK